MTAWPAAFLLAALLAGCSRAEPEPPPVLSTWAEQAAAAERAVQGKGQNFMLVDAGALPVRDKAGAPGEPIELKVYIFFIGPEASQREGEREPRYDARLVKFNDHRLATTLKVEDVRRARKDEVNPAGLGGVRFGPQDVLKATLSEGEAYMGKPVDRGNITINLLRTSSVPPEIKAPAVWDITYYSESGKYLTILVDAQTGAVLKRTVEETKEGRPEATTSPGT